MRKARKSQSNTLSKGDTDRYIISYLECLISQHLFLVLVSLLFFISNFVNTIG